MSARRSSMEVALPVRAAGVISSLLGLLTLASTGCTHRMPLDRRAFSLQGPAEFSIMAPSSSPSKPDNDFQEYRLELAGKEPLTNPPRAVDCMIKGTLFSLVPAKSSNPRLWVITSLTVQGWVRRSDSIDVQSEWMRLAHEVLALQ